MEKRKFNLWNRIVAAVVLAIACFTYVSTIEPTASFWDCGEFIASSYKLEIGHAPGNPTFQLFARFFTMFTDPQHAAIAVNIMSALCSGFTIFFLYLTIVFFAKKMVKPSEDGTYNLGKAISIWGAGAVGALAYCFSDTFWFSAVEAEVYAMSSLATALVFWAMTKWYDCADEPHANRWIVFISFIIGISIGIHLLNLLTIPCLVFMYWYRKHEAEKMTFNRFAGVLLLGFVLLYFVNFLLIPWLPKLAAYVDLFFVNVLGLPVNSGAAFFLAALLVLGFWSIFKTYRLGKVFWNTALLCLTAIVIGFSIFTVIVVRSSINPPTNENQPDNAFALVKYLNREQYGSAPLFYGEYFGSPYDGIKHSKYWAYLDDQGKYVHVDGPASAIYSPQGKMLFPRMWCNYDDRMISFYQSYMNGKGKTVPGADYKKPTFGANLKFFFDYQLNWMYWRYFFWNFVGRQNDIHSPSPGETFYGNWESGIGFVDKARLGDQSDAPAVLKNNKGKNHYFFLPLLLGLIGLCFQFEKDKRGCWLVFLLFFMTGIAIVLFLNQNPYQVRERDYAYAGSFYAFAIWIGFAVPQVFEWLTKLFKVSEGKGQTAIAAAVSVVLLGVPAIMAAENWDDHDRSNRRTSVEMAANYLNSVGKNGLLITHGDNDTFPLWYAQEVEGIRNDVRICNTSLLGTDWYIHQMKYAINNSPRLDLLVSDEQYLYGTNDYVRIYDSGHEKDTISVADIMMVFRHPKAKLTLDDGSKVDYIISRHISVPVNKENVLKYGILSPKYADQIPDHIVLNIPADKAYISKIELFILDFLSTYQWDRPLNMLSMGGDINIGLKDYLMYEGFSTKFVPIRNKITNGNLGKVELDDLVAKMNGVYKWDALKRTDYDIDYQNYYTFLGVSPQREIFLNVARLLHDAGRDTEAVAMLDKCQESVPDSNFPLESICMGFEHNDVDVLGMVDLYYKLGQKEKARDLGKCFADQLLASSKFFLDFYDIASDNFELCGNFIYYLADSFRSNGDKALADQLVDTFMTAVQTVYGSAAYDDAAQGDAQTQGDSAEGAVAGAVADSSTVAGSGE